MSLLDISDKNWEILQKFKKNISDVLASTHTDAYLMKWLRAGNFNLKRVECMFREATWCREMFDLDKLDSYSSVKSEVAKKYEFWSPLGFAKDGTPVSYVAMGRGDYKGFIHGMNSYDIYMYCSHCLEVDLRRAREQSIKLGKQISEITYIVDMEHFYLKKIFHTCVLEMSFDLLRMLQDLYPESWNRILLVNAQFYVYQAFNIMKPIFRDIMLQKLVVVSKEDSPNVLLKYIDADVLPVFLGGTRVDSHGDPMCSEFLKFGGVVPEEYYAGNKFLCPMTDSGFETVMIGRKSRYNHPFIIREPNSRLSFEIQSEGGSISICMHYRKFGPEPGEIDLPSSDEYLDPSDPKSNVEATGPCVKLQTHISTASTVCRLPKQGIYILVLDNSSNWMTTKKVTFRFKVLPPLR